MAGWEQRAKKLERSRRPQPKHGRSLLTAIRAAEEKRLRKLKKRAENRETRDSGS